MEKIPLLLLICLWHALCLALVQWKGSLEWFRRISEARLSKAKKVCNAL